MPLTPKMVPVRVWSCARRLRMDMLVDMNLRAIGEQLSRPLMITSPLIAWAETDNIPTVETKP